jgi:asparagine synthase (glutamine-hydrolysing)
LGSGHTFASNCDTEILPHLYEVYDVALPTVLRGMFGLAVWDEPRRRALLARDRLGIKPLYYAQVGELLVFASELKSLLASGLIDGALDYEAIRTYLTFGYLPGPRTPLLGVSKLPPGHRLVVARGKVEVDRYWAYPEPAALEGRSTDEWADGLLAELEDSVRLRLMADVPLGAMLSGGLDSSLIVALMARNMSDPVKTFSVGFKEDAEGNELADARKIAELYATDHHELELSYDDELDLDELVWYLDEPVADISTLGFLAISRLAASHVKVALSGQGADELFGGYMKHQAAWLCGYWDQIPGPARAAAGLAMRRAGGRFRRASRTLNAPDAASRLLAMSGKLDPVRHARLLQGPLAETRASAPLEVVRERLGTLDERGGPLATTLYLDAQLSLVDHMLHYFDRASMAHSLEVRVPFLDHRLVEYAATMPAALKVRRLETKHVLKYAARSLLPGEIISKRKRGFFGAATNDWLRVQLDGQLSERLLSPDARVAELLDGVELRRLVEAHRRGDGVRDRQLLLGILMLEIWLSTYLPRALPAGAAPIPHAVAVAL